MTQITTLSLTLKQPFTAREVHSILETLLSWPCGSAEPTIHLIPIRTYGKAEWDVENWDQKVCVQCDGVPSSTWLNLYETLSELISSSRITLSLSFNGLSDVDSTSKE